MTYTLKERKEVAPQDKWNVEALYPSLTQWQEKLKTYEKPKEGSRFAAITQYKGRLHEGAEVVKECLETIFKTSRDLTNLSTYAHLRHDEDITHNEHKQAFGLISAIMHDFATQAAWFEPELIALPQQTLDQYLGSPLLAPYRFHLEKELRIKSHTLSPDQEQLLALAGKALDAPHKAFSAINDADFKFGKVADGKGQEHELTHGTYAIYVRAHDPVLRKNAFQAMQGKYGRYENTLAELLNGEVQAHVFNARARHYSSCLDAALFPKNIDTQVYHSLITAVHNKIDVLHNYVKVRKRLLKIKEIYPWDFAVPLIDQVDIKMPFEQAVDVLIESVAPLGKQYQITLEKGLKENRWVDRFENKNKRSGAYSSGSYDSMPYILMNYRDLLRDVFTLTHEAGHSMHSYLSRENQPYHYAGYPIFLAEVASTFNEELLIRRLLESAKTKEEKIFLINQKIDDIRGTLFRQTLFAEFELAIHTLAEQDIPLTPAKLNELYRDLNKFYYGPEVVLDPTLDSEWARIPHFYYDFYVFQYATGISAAMALAEKVTHGKREDQEAYLEFLKSGSSRYPIDTLKLAGVDMRSPQPVEMAIHSFDKWVKELDKLTLN